MAKKYDKDLWFMMKALVIALFVMAALHGIKPYIVPPDPQADEIKKVALTIHPVLPEEVPLMLKNDEGKPTMLLVYASWCPYCRAMMPSVITLIEEHKLDFVQPVFLSIDRRVNLLSAYLVHGEYQSKFTPYRVEHLSTASLSETLASTGSGYDGAIPYVGFFTPSGKLVAEHYGTLNKNELLRMAASVKH